MGADASEYQIRIDVDDAPAAAGAERAVADIERVSEAQATATSATGQATAADEKAAVIMQEYGVSAAAAARTLELLGPAASTAAIGSGELEAALSAAQAELNVITPAQASYNAELRASAETLIAEMAALDQTTPAQERLGAATEIVKAALQRMGITEAEVTIQATKMNASLDATARAMIQIKQAALAAEVTAIRAQMEGVTVAAQANATGIEAVGAQLAQTGTQRHVLTSIREMARGGAYAIRGEAEATFLLGRALDTLLPGVGIFIAIASGVALVTQVMEEHSQKAQAAADKAKEKTEAAESSSKAYAEDLKSAFGEMEKSAKTAFDSIGEMYQGLIAQTRAAINATKELQSAQDELKSAKLAAQIALLNAQEEEEEDGKTPDQRAIIKRRFEAQRLNLRQEFDEDKAKGEVESRQAELAQVQADLALKKKELSDEENKYAEALKDADNAGQGLIANNVQSDAEYAESQIKALREKRDRGTASRDDLIKLEGFEDSAPLLRQKENESGKSFQEQNKRLVAALDANEKTAHDHPDEAIGERAASHAQDIKDQLRAIAYYQSAIGALAEATKTNSKDQLEGRTAVTEEEGKIAALGLRIQAAELKAARLTVVDATDQRQLHEKQTKEEAEHDFGIRQAQRDAARKLLLDQSENSLATPDQRAAYKAQADQIAAQGDRDKLTNAEALGLSDADRIKLGGDIAGSQIKGQNVVARQNQKDAEQEAEQQVADYKQRIEQAGHALPEAARKVLDDAMRKIEAMDRANPIKEALDLLNLYIDRQNVINERNADDIDKLRARVHKML